MKVEVGKWGVSEFGGMGVRKYGGCRVVQLSVLSLVEASGYRVVGVTGQFRDFGYKQAECFLPQRTPRFKLIRGLALSELHSFILRLSFSRSLRKKAEAFLSHRWRPW